VASKADLGWTVEILPSMFDFFPGMHSLFNPKCSGVKAIWHVWTAAQLSLQVGLVHAWVLNAPVSQD
jgi:hypothetical protein